MSSTPIPFAYPRGWVAASQVAKYAGNFVSIPGQSYDGGANPPAELIQYVVPVGTRFFFHSYQAILYEETTINEVRAYWTLNGVRVAEGLTAVVIDAQDVEVLRDVGPGVLRLMVLSFAAADISFDVRGSIRGVLLRRGK